MSKVAENIRNFRIFRGLSQRDLGDKLNKTSAVICNWEKGINSPDLDSVEKLCFILDCSPNELFGWDKNPALESFLKQKEHLLYEVQKLTKARELLDKQIADYYDQMEKLNPEIDMDKYSLEVLESLPLAVKRRAIFTQNQNKKNEE